MTDYPQAADALELRTESFKGTYDTLNATQKADLIARFYPAVAADATVVLAWLDEKKIIVTMSEDKLDYEDYR